MDKAENRAAIYSGVLKYGTIKKQDAIEHIYKLVVAVIMIGLWQSVAMKVDNQLILPYPLVTAKAFIKCVTDPVTVKNILITLNRVIKGFLVALAYGLPIGFIMGFSKVADRLMGGFIDSIRQVPIMAWVPLTIVWFGIGDGPTIFLIAFSGVFPVILNTIQGVRGISKDYFNAAKSMGAGRISIFFNVILPGSLPDILTAARIAISAGWMSVIWAEFIATSAGLGYSMVEAQTRMQTETLIALMFFAAFVGFGIDRVIQYINRAVTKWRYAE